MDKWEIQHKIDNNTLNQMIALDREVYSKRDLVDIDRCRQWLSVNPDIYTVLKYNGNVVGYINFVPLKDEVYAKFERGQIKDYDLTREDITSFHKGETLNCLLLSVVLKKEFRDGEAIIKLVDGFKEFLEELRTQGVMLGKIIQDCVSIDGIKFALHTFGAHFVRDSHREHGFGKIYEADLNSPSHIRRPKLRYEELNPGNLSTMARIQYEIFRDTYSVIYSDYRRTAPIQDKLKSHVLPIEYLVYYRNIPVGIVGLYNIEGYPDDIWMDCLGVLPQYRNRGIGTSMLLHICEIARSYGKKTLRLYSFSKTYPLGVKIYKKLMQRMENYRNAEDDPAWLEEMDCVVFSSSLVDRRPPLWRDKYIDIRGDKKTHEESLRLLKEDGIIE